jgi:hypothetical protein
MKSLIRQPRPRKAVVTAIPKKCRAVKTFDVFEELFADDFVDHTPGQTPLVEIRQTITVRAESANQFLNK